MSFPGYWLLWTEKRGRDTVQRRCLVVVFQKSKHNDSERSSQTKHCPPREVKVRGWHPAGEGLDTTEKLCISAGLLNTESIDRRLPEGSKRVLTNERMQVLASVKKGGRVEKERNKQKAKRMEMTAWSEELEWFIKANGIPLIKLARDQPTLSLFAGWEMDRTRRKRKQGE